MSFPSLELFFQSAAFSALPKGPVAVILAEDSVALAETLKHHDAQGFAAIIVLGTVDAVEIDSAAPIFWVREKIASRELMVAALNRLIKFLPKRWVYYGFNAEFLFYPYCKSRSVIDLVNFMVEERREAIFTYALDIYADDLHRNPSGVDLEHASFDRSGYYGFQRNVDGHNLDRQFDIFGGLGWRFEEFVPWERRRIDRVSMFLAQPGLELNSDLQFNIPEYNTVSCPWHHNITIAIASFRVAKSLKRNPGSTFEIDSFKWAQSERFEWDPQQLMELGFIEPGQWF